MVLLIIITLTYQKQIQVVFEKVIRFSGPVVCNDTECADVTGHGIDFRLLKILSGCLNRMLKGIPKLPEAGVIHRQPTTQYLNAVVERLHLSTETS